MKKSILTAAVAGTAVPTQPPSLLGKEVLNLGDTTALRINVFATDPGQKISALNLAAFIFSPDAAAWMRFPALDVALVPSVELRGYTFERSVLAPFCGESLIYQVVADAAVITGSPQVAENDGKLSVVVQASSALKQ